MKRTSRTPAETLQVIEEHLAKLRSKPGSPRNQREIENWEEVRKIALNELGAEPSPWPWIPVCESLPPKHPQAFTTFSRRVLVLMDSEREAHLAVYDVCDKRWHLQSEHLVRGEITHWMPIPPAPKRRR